MQVAIYIYKDDVRYRLELFQDENISITSSIQNVNDISKVFTDYSQSFTIPATPTIIRYLRIGTKILLMMDLTLISDMMQK